MGLNLHKNQLHRSKWKQSENRTKWKEREIWSKKNIKI